KNRAESATPLAGQSGEKKPFCSKNCCPPKIRRIPKISSVARLDITKRLKCVLKSAECLRSGWVNTTASSKTFKRCANGINIGHPILKDELFIGYFNKLYQHTHSNQVYSSAQRTYFEKTHVCPTYGELLYP